MIGYSHALWRNELDLETIHVSGMLDNDTRSPLCGIIAILSGVALVALELSRQIGWLPTRLTLATACGVGILQTCRIRESESYPLHATAACVAFGAGIALVWLVTILSGLVRTPWCRLPAIALSLICLVTGTGQSLSLLQLVRLPTPFLAIGEGLMIIGFGVNIAAISMLNGSGSGRSAANPASIPCGTQSANYQAALPAPAVRVRRRWSHPLLGPCASCWGLDGDRN